MDSDRISNLIEWLVFGGGILPVSGYLTYLAWYRPDDLEKWLRAKDLLGKYNDEGYRRNVGLYALVGPIFWLLFLCFYLHMAYTMYFTTL